MSGGGPPFRLPLPTTLSALSLLLLAGCSAGPQDWSAIAQQAAQIRSGCESRRAAGTTALGTEQCANPAIHKLYADAGYPDLDIIDAYLAKREAIAAQEDQGGLIPPQAAAAFARADADKNATLAQRASDRAVSSAAPTPIYCSRPSLSSMSCN